MHEHHYIPGGYIYSPTTGHGTNGHVYWTHYHAGNWVTDHSNIWKDTVWVDGVPAPEVGFPAIKEFAETVPGLLPTVRPTWIEDPKETLGYDMADCWASCMIPFDWGLQYDPVAFCSSQRWYRAFMSCRWMRTEIPAISIHQPTPLKTTSEHVQHHNSLGTSVWSMCKRHRQPTRDISHECTRLLMR